MTALDSTRGMSAAWACWAWRSGCGGWAAISKSRHSRAAERWWMPNCRCSNWHEKTNMKPIRILVADDHTVVRDGLRAVLERQPDMEIVAEAADGRECLRLAEEHSPDVVV